MTEDVSWVPVVVGFLKKSDQILLGQRPLDEFWEFPGGKIKANESPGQALYRELYEELGVKAKVGALKLVFTHGPLIILFYDVVLWEGELQPLYHKSLRWVPVQTIGHLNIPEANRVHLDEIVDVIS